MSSKRKYLFDNDSEDSGDDADFFPSENETPQPRPHKRARHQARQDRASTAGTKSRRKAKTTKIAALDELSAKLEAELADLDDFNTPPKARIEEDSDEAEPVRLRRRLKRKAEMSHELPESRKSRKIIDSEEDEESRKSRKIIASEKDEKSPQTAKPQTSRKRSAPRPKAKPKRSLASRLQDEVGELQPLAHWGLESEEEALFRRRTRTEWFVGGRIKNNDGWPQSHAHPPKEFGVQNASWSSLPAEIRNEIYQYCMVNEKKNFVNLLHYPSGVPRRSVRGTFLSSTNFLQSYWAFTQTCMDVRREFTPWLLSKRKVRTPLATINKYVDTFHRRDPATGQRVGTIQLMCNDGPLPDEGVEILQLIREKDRSPDFHLQLTPTVPQSSSPNVSHVIDLTTFDELDIFRTIDEHRHHTSKFDSIHITSIPRPREHVEDSGFNYESEDAEDGGFDDGSEKVEPRNIVLKFEFGISSLANHDAWDQRQHMNKTLFGMGLADYEGLQVKANTSEDGIGRWDVSSPDVLDMFWDNDEGFSVLRRYTLMFGPNGRPTHYITELLD